jgi:hypothetical protein
MKPRRKAGVPAGMHLDIKAAIATSEGPMIPAKTIFHLAFSHVSALAIAASVAGCGPHVTTGSSGDGGEGGSGEGGSSGATGSCSEYAGDGCEPEEVYDCGYSDITMSDLSMTCSLDPDKACTTYWDNGCDTPLVLSFDGAPVEYLADRDHGFDLDGAQSLVTDWPTARTPWLAVDRDGNGSIDDGSELFGSMSPLGSGARARNGFAALRELDANGDGRLTPQDPGFSRLLVWSDGDGDRRSAASELASVSGRGLLSIDLAYTSGPRCDARGNCEVERASFTYRDAAGMERTGAVVDVHIARQR